MASGVWKTLYSDKCIVDTVSQKGGICGIITDFGSCF